MADPVKKQPMHKPLPEANVIYSPQSQVLIIENRPDSAVGETIARDVVVFYDKDVDDEPSSAVAIRIDCAEHVLKPFVDAILAKYGITPDQQPAATEAQT